MTYFHSSKKGMTQQTLISLILIAIVLAILVPWIIQKTISLYDEGPGSFITKLFEKQVLNSICTDNNTLCDRKNPNLKIASGMKIYSDGSTRFACIVNQKEYFPDYEKVTCAMVEVKTCNTTLHSDCACIIKNYPQGYYVKKYEGKQDDMLCLGPGTDGNYFLITKKDFLDLKITSSKKENLCLKYDKLGRTYSISQSSICEEDPFNIGPCERGFFNNLFGLGNCRNVEKCTAGSPDCIGKRFVEEEKDIIYSYQSYKQNNFLKKDYVCFMNSSKSDSKKIYCDKISFTSFDNSPKCNNTKFSGCICELLKGGSPFVDVLTDNICVKEKNDKGLEENNIYHFYCNTDKKCEYYSTSFFQVGKNGVFSLSSKNYENLCKADPCGFGNCVYDQNTNLCIEKSQD